MLPLLCRAVEDGYGKSRGFSWLILKGLVVSKLELESPMSESSTRMVVRGALPGLSLLWRVGCRYGERCGLSLLMEGIVMSTSIIGSSYWNYVSWFSFYQCTRKDNSLPEHLRLVSLAYYHPCDVAVTRKESIWVGPIRKRTHFTRRPLIKTHWSRVMVEICSP